MTRRTGKVAPFNSIITAVTGGAGHDSRRPLVMMGVLIGACVLAFMLFLGAAAILQLGDPDEVEMDVARVATRNDAFVGTRGTIFDSSGHRVLAVTVSDMSVRWEGGGWDDDFIRVANGLATALNMNRVDIYRKFRANIGKGVIVKRHISDLEEEQIRLQRLPWVSLVPDTRRYYPLEIVMGAALGYVAPDDKREDVMNGLLGVESTYNDVLSPSTRKVRMGRTSNISSRQGQVPGDGWLLDGADIDLTIDARLQMVLDNALYGAMVREQALGGMAVMLDAKTSEVLAMSSYPFLDPNRYQEACAETEKKDDGSSACVNKVLTYAFEPGSVAKTFSLAAALESGQFSLKSLVNGSGGTCYIGKSPVHDVHGRGVMTLADAIKYSSNCGVQDMARHLEPAYLQGLFRRFGMGRKSGIDMPDKGDASIDRKWSLSDSRTASYGYTFRTTQISLARAFGAIVNDGLIQDPRIVKRVRWPDGTVVDLKRSEPERVISGETARDVRFALRRVVMEDDGTGKGARPRLYTAAGKTGTSRIAGTKKEDKQLNCSFVGYAPADNPRVIIAVTVIYPKVHTGGGSAAGPVFAETVDNGLPILGVEPEFKPEAIAVPTAAMTQSQEAGNDDRH